MRVAASRLSPGTRKHFPEPLSTPPKTHWPGWSRSPLQITVIVNQIYLERRKNHLTFAVLLFSKQAFIDFNDLSRSTNGLDLGDHCIDANLPAETGPVNGTVTAQAPLPGHRLLFQAESKRGKLS